MSPKTRDGISDRASGVLLVVTMQPWQLHDAGHYSSLLTPLSDNKVAGLVFIQSAVETNADNRLMSAVCFQTTNNQHRHEEHYFVPEPWEAKIQYFV